MPLRLRCRLAFTVLVLGFTVGSSWRQAARERMASHVQDGVVVEVREGALAPRRLMRPEPRTACERSRGGGGRAPYCHTWMIERRTPPPSTREWRVKKSQLPQGFLTHCLPKQPNKPSGVRRGGLEACMALEDRRLEEGLTTRTRAPLSGERTGRRRPLLLRRRSAAFQPAMPHWRSEALEEADAAGAWRPSPPCGERSSAQ